MKYIILEKIKSKLNWFHPNGVEAGSLEIRGWLSSPITVGEQLVLTDTLGRPFSWTSTVESFTDTEIHTKNSIYKIHEGLFCENCQKLLIKTIVVNEEHCCPNCISTNVEKLEL
jgi:hypothetical protein